MNHVSEIFLNQEREAQVDLTHQQIRETFLHFTLEEILVLGFNWSKTKANNVKESSLKELIKFFYRWKYSESKEALISFGLYDRVALQNARHRAKFLQRMKNIEWIHKALKNKTRISLANLELISLYDVEYPTTAYAIKCYLLCNFSDKEIFDYKGMQAFTSPVVNNSKKLFGINETGYRHTLRCNLVGAEIKKSACYVNTALWSM